MSTSIDPEDQEDSMNARTPQRMHMHSMFIRAPLPLQQRRNQNTNARSFSFQCTPRHLMLSYILILYFFMSTRSTTNHNSGKDNKMESATGIVNGTNTTSVESPASLSLFFVLMPSVVFLCMSILILRRIRILRQLEMDLIRGSHSDIHGLSFFSDARSPLSNRLRLMLATRDFGAEDYDALLGLEEGTSSSSQHRKATQEDLHKLPIQVITEKDLERKEDCPVCLEAFEVEDTVRTLPCLHRMHGSCIDPWLTEQNATCPVCKFSAIAE